MTIPEPAATGKRNRTISPGATSVAELGRDRSSIAILHVGEKYRHYLTRDGGAKNSFETAAFVRYVASPWYRDTRSCAPYRFPNQRTRYKRKAVPQDVLIRLLGSGGSGQQFRGPREMAKRAKRLITDEDRLNAEEAISTVARQVKFSIAEYPVSVYVSRFQSDTGDRYFVPLYQRNLAWSDEQKSQFIESLLVGLPIPFLFFYQTENGRMEIVDGSQRLRAIRAFLKEGLRLSDLVMIPELNGFSFNDLPEDRRNKLEDVTIRAIILDTDTDPSTRAEMFARINRMGTTANEAEIRRGSIPGPVTQLITDLAESQLFVSLTPLSAKAVSQREREELVTRFFAYLNTNETPNGRFPGYKDRPKKFLFDFLKMENARAEEDPQLINRMREEFNSVMEFVRDSFPLGFRKAENANTVPRVRFEAISVGAGLALRNNPHLEIAPHIVAERMERDSFNRVVVSDGANVRSKLEGRIDLVKNLLEE